MSKENNAIAEVSNHWRNVWKNSTYGHLNSRPSKLSLGRWMRLLTAKFGGLSDNRYILKSILLKEVPDFSGLKILDAGAGTGLNSLSASMRGADVTLLDIAPEALAIARVYYEELGLQAKYIEGSIFEIPFPDGTFDIVWNTGVIEHFTTEVRAKALSEMLRVLKPGGRVITLNPYKNGRIYAKMKEIADRTGQWQAGVEYPILTLAEMTPPGYSLREYSRGYLMQYHYCKYLFPKALRMPWILFHEGIQTLLNFLNRFPGYLLVSVIRKPG